MIVPCLKIILSTILSLSYALLKVPSNILIQSMCKNLEKQNFAPKVWHSFDVWSEKAMRHLPQRHICVKSVKICN